jgi:hypothetical protein
MGTGARRPGPCFRKLLDSDGDSYERALKSADGR